MQHNASRFTCAKGQEEPAHSERASTRQGPSRREAEGFESGSYDMRARTCPRSSISFECPPADNVLRRPIRSGLRCHENDEEQVHADQPNVQPSRSPSWIDSSSAWTFLQPYAPVKRPLSSRRRSPPIRS